MATRDDRRRSREREYEEGLVVIQEMVNKLNTILQEGTQSFTSADYMRFYTYPSSTLFHKNQFRVLNHGFHLFHFLILL